MDSFTLYLFLFPNLYPVTLLKELAKEEEEKKRVREEREETTFYWCGFSEVRIFLYLFYVRSVRALSQSFSSLVIGGLIKGVRQRKANL